MLDEEHLKVEPLALVDAINATLLNKATLRALSKNILSLSKPDAARDTARLIINAIDR